MYLSNIRIDQKKRDEGVWHEIADGFCVKVARMNNANYNKKIEEITSKFKQGRKFVTLTSEQTKSALIEAVSETIILDWKGLFEQEGGEEIKYTKENAVAILSDPECESIFDTIYELATNDENYRKEVLVETVKKSPSTSRGKKSGAKT